MRKGRNRFACVVHAHCDAGGGIFKEIVFFNFAAFVCLKKLEGNIIRIKFYTNLALLLLDIR